MDAPHREIRSVLEQCREALAGYFARETGEELLACEVERVVHHTFSTVLFLRVRTAMGVHRLVTKTTVYHCDNQLIIDRENQAVVEFTILQQLWHKFQGIDKCSVPRPVLVLPQLETYIMEFVEGYSLADELRYVRHFASRKGFHSLEESYYHVGRWLKHFQDCTQGQAPVAVAFQAPLERCEHRLKILEAAADPRYPKDLRSRVQKLLDEWLAQLAGEPVLIAGCHGDFGSWNILTGPEGIHVIDFMGYQKSPIAVDVLGFLLELEKQERCLTSSRRRIAVLRKSFLDGYGVVPQIPRAAALLCEAMHRVYYAYGPLRVVEKWPHRRIEQRRSFTVNLEWLLDECKRKSAWPGYAVS
jgi:hypothetical protein